MTLLLLSGLIFFYYLNPLFQSTEVIIRYGLTPFDICAQNPDLWHYLKIAYLVSFIFSNLMISQFILNRFIFRFSIFKKLKFKKIHKSILQHDELSLLIGFNSNEDIYVSSSGLFQNFLITGTIGSGKTSSAMYPFTNQFLKYNSRHSHKLGMLILDVKGNYYKQVNSFASTLNLQNDIVEISLTSGIYYNPLHKPNLKAQVLSQRLKTILLLFSENNSDSFWIDKAEQILCEAIKLCRYYNNYYVTFLELHKLITSKSYYDEKIKIVKQNFLQCKYEENELYELNMALDFFDKEFFCLDDRTKGILTAEITRITNVFISDYDVCKTFCPKKEKLNLLGFDDILENGKIVVLNLNLSTYSSLSRIIATYLKLDFQTEVLNNLAKNSISPSIFICDEYDKYASKTDSEFFSVSREAKCINIVSTQSYTSLKNALKDEACVKVIIQNLINKIWFRTDDMFTIEEAQKQLGKEDKVKTSQSISENSTNTRFSYITNAFNSNNSNLSETCNTYTQNEFIYDTRFFTQNLETFTAISFLSDGHKIYPPSKINLLPYFKNN